MVWFIWQQRKIYLLQHGGGRKVGAHGEEVVEGNVLVMFVYILFTDSQINAIRWEAIDLFGRSLN